MPGSRIIVASWLANGLFAATAIPAAAGVGQFDTAAAVVALGLFLVSMGVWAYAFGVGLVRSARGDNVAVANLFLLQGSAPREVQRQLFGSLAVCVALAVVTGFREPAGFLVPMLPLGLAGMWAARHGTFPPREAPAARATRSAVARGASRDAGRASARRRSGRTGE